MRERFGLAPMEGVSDWPLRLWFSQVSAPTFMSTPFLRATDTFPKLLPPDFAPELSRHVMPYELIPQVMASRPEDFVRAARLFLDEGASFVDLNCGCPSPNPVSGGAGSSLLKSSKIFIDFIETIARDLPPESFSVKMRTGFDDTTHFDAAIEGIKQIPMRQLTVHGRTRKDRYDGHARWDLIEKARAALPYPVVASGDILSYKHWQEKKALHPTLQNVIIGRGALRNPWIFAELREGGSLSLSKRSLVLALASFAQILELSYNAPEKLEALVSAGLFRGTCGVDEASWEDLWRNLSEKPPTAIEAERFAFGRTKMIWNSLRSSLPPEYFDPTLLRAKSVAEFLTAIASRGEDAFGVKHAPEWDWLYTSSRIKPEPNLSEQKVPL